MECQIFIKFIFEKNISDLFHKKRSFRVYIYAKNEFWVWHFFEFLGHVLIFAMYNAFFDHMCKIAVEKFEPQNIGTQKIKTQKIETQKIKTQKIKTQKIEPQNIEVQK